MDQSFTVDSLTSPATVKLAFHYLDGNRFIIVRSLCRHQPSSLHWQRPKSSFTTMKEPDSEPGRTGPPVEAWSINWTLEDSRGLREAVWPLLNEHHCQPLTRNTWENHSALTFGIRFILTAYSAYFTHFSKLWLSLSCRSQEPCIVKLCH